MAQSDAKPTKAESGAMQAGARHYPEPPFRKQDQAKPGSETELDPAPMYDAPYYKGSGKLEGKVAIITGGAAHLVPRGIRVNAVAPGPVWTPLNPSDKTAADVATFGAQTPMKRPAQPEEIAPAYVFLVSSHCSSYITGEILPIIGGY